MSSSKLKLLILMMLLSLTSYAQEAKSPRTEPRISGDFYRGAYLIYDCRSRHYACVNDKSFKLCRVMRDRAYQDKKKLLFCAPLKKFKSQKSCFEKQYLLIHEKKTKGYCQNIRS